MATGCRQIEQGGQGSEGGIVTRTDLVGSSHSKVVQEGHQGGGRGGGSSALEEFILKEDKRTNCVECTELLGLRRERT